MHEKEPNSSIPNKVPSTNIQAVACEKADKGRVDNKQESEGSLYHCQSPTTQRENSKSACHYLILHDDSNQTKGNIAKDGNSLRNGQASRTREQCEKCTEGGK